MGVHDATEWASFRVAEGGADDMMNALARCYGTSAERQLHLWAEQQPWRGLVPQPYAFQAPKILKDTEVMDQRHCLLPHEIFARIGCQAPHVFEQLFGSAEDRKHFWSELQRTSQQMLEGDRASEHKR